MCIRMWIGVSKWIPDVPWPAASLSLQPCFAPSPVTRLCPRLHPGNEGGLPLEQAVLYTRHILHGVCFIHEQGIFHADLKPRSPLLILSPPS